ncbi:hypothetical protein KAR91_13195 [Candidatus Pacearchaeota archaeon]|nr:hypothetical protein [Candidatus Pacearchaeota archaeon]
MGRICLAPTGFVGAERKLRIWKNFHCIGRFGRYDGSRLRFCGKVGLGDLRCYYRGEWFSLLHRGFVQVGLCAGFAHYKSVSLAIGHEVMDDSAGSKKGLNGGRQE